MHQFDQDAAALAERVFDHLRDRLGQSPPPLGKPLDEEEVRRRVGETVTQGGIGSEEAFRVFTETLLPSCLNTAHPRFLSFIPHAPTKAAALLDAALASSGVCADWWIEGSGAVFAENEALAWIAGLLGWPAGEAGGVFVSGGTAGNLSALAVARDVWRRDRPGAGDAGVRPSLAISAGGHSSFVLAARVLDVEVIDVPTDDDGRMVGAALSEALDAAGPGAFAVAATAGTTNLGAVDDLAGIAEVCAERDLWLHVDGAYGGAALASASARPLFAGVERADSFVVDPHKWLFTPFDCAALVYRRPSLARRAFTQSAEYIDVIEDRAEWNPSDYAVHLSRRPRGLPFWFSLAANGTEAYAAAIDHSLKLAGRAAEMIEAAPHLELARQPTLSIVVFTRKGWDASRHQRWSDEMLASGLTMTAPTSWRGETLLRFCFVNPATTEDDVRRIIDSLA